MSRWAKRFSNCRRINSEADRTVRFGLTYFGSGCGPNQIGLWNLNWIDEEHRAFLGTAPEVLAAMERILALWTEHRVVPGPNTPGPPGDGFASQWASKPSRSRRTHPVKPGHGSW